MHTPCTDIEDVNWAADLLGVTEFQLFQRAYEACHRSRATERCIERFFVSYMFEGTAPYWVNQFSRQVLIEHAEAIQPRRHGHGGLWRDTLCLALHLLVAPRTPRSLGPLRHSAILA